MKIAPLLATIVVFLLGACAHPPGKKPASPSRSWLDGLNKLLPKSKPRPPAATPVDWAGTIRLVNAAEHFVLIESESATPVVPGAKYLCVAGGRESATLLMTSLKSHPFFIADIVSGSPSTGDKIYIPHPTCTEPPGGNPATAPDQN